MDKNAQDGRTDLLKEIKSKPRNTVFVILRGRPRFPRRRPQNPELHGFNSSSMACNAASPSMAVIWPARFRFEQPSPVHGVLFDGEADHNSPEKSSSRPDSRSAFISASAASSAAVAWANVTPYSSKAGNSVIHQFCHDVDRCQFRLRNPNPFLNPFLKGPFLVPGFRGARAPFACPMAPSRLKWRH